ncbi:MAG: hypothetical protein ACI4WW_03710 [Candidatus Coprovivens sp.]
MKNNVQNTILKIFVGIMCFCVALIIIALFFDNLEGIFEKMWFTALLVMPYALPSLCCFSILGKGKPRTFISIIGLIITICSYLWSVGLVWNFFDIKDLFGDSIFYFNLIVGAYVFGHSSLLLLIDNKNIIVKSFQYLAIIILLFLFVSTFEPIFEVVYNNDIGEKVFVTEILLIGLGTVASPILNFVYKEDKKYPNVVNTSFGQFKNIVNNNESKKIQ